MTMARGDAGSRQGGVLLWKGAGWTAFTGAAGAEPVGTAQPRWVQAGEDLATLFGERGLPELRRAMSDFFAGGGRGAYLLDEPRLGDGSWVGDDGGPGRTSGIYALAELEDVGTLVLPGALPSSARERVKELAASRPDLFFVLAGSGGGLESGPARGAAAGRGWMRGGAGGHVPGRASGSGDESASPVDFLGPNVVEVREPLRAGALVSYLETTDFRVEASWGAPKRIDPPSGLEHGDLIRFVAWRRREGLRRSIDWGTRWLVFELHHPFVWRRAEREVSAFLYRLASAGFLGDPGGRLDFAVSCEPAVWRHGNGPQATAESPNTEPGSGPAAEEIRGVVVRVHAALRPARGETIFLPGPRC